MIGKISGIIDEILSDALLIDVNGVGYVVYAPLSILRRVVLGQKISLYTELHVREDLMQLFGFESKSQKAAFTTLTQVSGVGVKLAISILSHITVQDLISTIISKNCTILCAVPGVGKKIAERMTLELQDKFNNVQNMLMLEGIVYEAPNNAKVAVNNAMLDDAVSALINLGIKPQQATENVTRILKEQPEITLSDLIRVSLQKTPSTQ